MEPTGRSEEDGEREMDGGRMEKERISVRAQKKKERQDKREPALLLNEL